MRHLLVLLLLLPLLSLAEPSLTLTPGQYRILNEIQGQLSENHLDEAKAQLEKFENKLDPSFALALAYQLHGQLFLMQEDTQQGLQYFQKALDLNVLEPAQEVNIATTVAQIQLSMEQPKAAYAALVSRVNKVLDKEVEVQEQRNKKRDNEMSAPVRLVQPQAFITLATACQLQKDYKTSIPWLEKALARTEEAKENWLLMLMVAHYQEKNYQAAANVLNDLIRVNPSKEDYYTQQAAMYQLLEQPKLALRSLELGYGAGHLTQSSHIMQLVQLLINQNVPERAARILSKHLDDKTIELSDSNWRILAAAWMQSREREQAAATLVLASEKQKDGKLLLRAAQLRAQDANHSNALKNAQRALQKGLDDKDKAQALMLAASSAYELKDLATARRYFQQALAYASVASNAKSWLDYIGALEEFNF